MSKTERVLLWGGLVITWAKPVLKAINTVIGLGGLPDDLTAWRALLGHVVGGYTVLDWLLLAVGSLCLLFVLFPSLRERAFSRRRLVPAGAHAFPPEVTQRPTRKMTDVNRERCSLAIRDLFDFVSGELAPYRARLNEIQYPNAPGLAEVRADLEQLNKKGGKVWQDHHLYFDMMDHLDMLPALQTLEALRNPLARYAESLGWVAEARGDRLMTVHENAMAFQRAIHALLRDIADRQERFIDG